MNPLGSTFVHCGIEWTQISTYYAIANQQIAFSNYGKTNNYLSSELRPFLLNWYKINNKK